MSAPGGVVSRTRREPVERVTVEDLLSRLESVRRNGEGRWMAKCPAHGDRTASLSIRVGDGDRILVHDFGGCSFTEVVEALGLRPEQLFPPSDAPWRPRAPRPDPDRAARAFLERLRGLRRPPAPERMRRELAFIGRLILGGTRAFAEVPASFSAESIQTFPLRLVYLAIVEVAKQGTPRRWFSPLALAREVERVGGRENVFMWARMAVGTARWERT